MNRTSLSALVVVLALAPAWRAGASPSSPQEQIVGTWNGTSTCVDRARNPACKDEVVIYEFRRTPGDAQKVSLAADKVVAGERLRMYEQDFVYDPAQAAWLGEFRKRSAHGLWKYVIHGKSMEGTLVDLLGNFLVRRIAVERP